MIKKIYEIIAKLCLNSHDEKCDFLCESLCGGNETAISTLKKSCDEKNVKSCESLAKFYKNLDKNELASIQSRLCEFGQI